MIIKDLQREGEENELIEEKRDLLDFKIKGTLILFFIFIRQTKNHSISPLAHIPWEIHSGCR